MAPTRYKMNPVTLASRNGIPRPISKLPKNSPSPAAIGKTTSFHPALLEVPLRTMTENVQKKRHTRRTPAREAIIPD